MTTGDPHFPGYTVVSLALGDDLETRALDALITAQPKTIIELPAGTFNFPGELSVSVDNIVLRGQGMTANGGTVLNFAGQTSGAQGILATGNNFVVEDLAVEDTPGDGIKMEGNDGVTMRRVRVEWTNGPEGSIGQFNISSILGGGFAGAIPPSTDPAPFNCSHASLPPIELEPPVDPSNPTEPNPLELCDVAGSGRNVDAYPADCPNLSDYRLFADASNPLANANGGVIYDLNTPLFTDYANKYRFVFVPEGTKAAYRATAVFDFPVGTIIAKTFTIQADLRLEDSDQDIIETRLLIRRRDGWTALPYIWNGDKSDAVLTKTGGTQPINWIDKDGLPRFTDYVIPNTNNCANCHGEDNLIPIGPTARSLNKDYAYDSGPANQLDHWTAMNILSGAPADTASIPSIPLWEDTSANLDDRARGYLDVNCAHCHIPGGAGDTSGLFLDYFRPFGPDVGECKPPVAAGGGSGGRSYDIVPGSSTQSILVYRMDSNELEVRMPEVGRSIIHPEGVELIADWIDAMALVDCDAP